MPLYRVLEQHTIQRVLLIHGDSFDDAVRRWTDDEKPEDPVEHYGEYVTSPMHYIDLGIEDVEAESGAVEERTPQLSTLAAIAAQEVAAEIVNWHSLHAEGRAWSFGRWSLQTSWCAPSPGGQVGRPHLRIEGWHAEHPTNGFRDTVPATLGDVYWSLDRWCS